jgi:hypothetical protein
MLICKQETGVKRIREQSTLICLAKLMPVWFYRNYVSLYMGATPERRAENE